MSNKQRITIELDSHTVELLDACAEREDRSRSSVVRRALAQAFGDQPRGPFRQPTPDGATGGVAR